MNAIIANPMVTTAALPLLLGFALGLCERIPDLRAPAVAGVLWAGALLFLHRDTAGLSSFPPIAAAQKLIYLALAGILVGLFLSRALQGKATPALAFAAPLLSLSWLGWSRLSSGDFDLKLAVAGAVTVLIAVSTAALHRATSEPESSERPFLAPAATLATGFAGAISSVLGASIIVGQLLGSLVFRH